MAFTKNPDANPSGSGPNDSCWNKKGYNKLGPNSVVGGQGSKPSWNVRFDYKPGDMRSTYYTTGGNSPFNTPIGMNAAKNFRSVSNAPKGK